LRASVAREPSSKPHGKAEVRAALLEAARRLFAEHGTATVSVRDIAAAAGVNHGLVHRHFGSKRALLHAALEADTAGADGPVGSSHVDHTGAGDFGNAHDLLEAVVQRDPQLRTLARAILDGEMPADLGNELPGAERLVDAIVELGRCGQLAPEFDPRLVAAATLALALGWTLFEPVVADATGLTDDEGDANQARIEDLVLTLIGRMRAGERKQTAR